MKIIQHRVNDVYGKKLASYAEIDVWENNGGIVCCHTLKDMKVYPSWIHAAKNFKGYFVNVKHPMGVDQLNLIMEMLGGRENIVGFFDVPWPGILDVTNANLPVYFRFSEYEDCSHYASRVWLDPLDNQETHSYNLIYKLPYETKIIIASPELHGHGIEHSKKIWRHLKKEFIHYIGGKQGGIEGIVTKWPEEAEKVFNV